MTKDFKQIVTAIESFYRGKNVKDICKEMDIKMSTFYRWKTQHGGIAKEYMRIKLENERLHKMYSNLSLMYDVLRETLNGFTRE